MSAHPSLWFDDGNVVLSIENSLFKVHRSILNALESYNGLPLINLRVGIANRADVEALLQHLYHNIPLLPTSPFGQTARILRAATQFQFQGARDLALGRLEQLYPRRPLPFEYTNWPYLHEATQLARDCRVREILPALLYAIVTTSDFEVGEGPNDHPASESTAGPQAPRQGLADDDRGQSLSASTTQLCVKLMNRIMDHFTPILFTVSTSSHMECTSVFADHWMEYAIQPAIVDSGVYKPLETLKKIQLVDWSSLGLCEACCMEKREEWDGEAANIWSKLDSWAELGTLFAENS